jgi:hypothetical protein
MSREHFKAALQEQRRARQGQTFANNMPPRVWRENVQRIADRKGRSISPQQWADLDYEYNQGTSYLNAIEAVLGWALP